MKKAFRDSIIVMNVQSGSAHQHIITCGKFARICQHGREIFSTGQCLSKNPIQGLVGGATMLPEAVRPWRAGGAVAAGLIMDTSLCCCSCSCLWPANPSATPFMHELHIANCTFTAAQNQFKRLHITSSYMLPIYAITIIATSRSCCWYDCIFQHVANMHVSLHAGAQMQL